MYRKGVEKYTIGVIEMFILIEYNDRKCESNGA